VGGNLGHVLFPGSFLQRILMGKKPFQDDDLKGFFICKLLIWGKGFNSTNDFPKKNKT